MIIFEEKRVGIQDMMVVITDGQGGFMCLHHSQSKENFSSVLASIHALTRERPIFIHRSGRPDHMGCLKGTGKKAFCLTQP